MRTGPQESPDAIEIRDINSVIVPNLESRPQALPSGLIETGLAEQEEPIPEGFDRRILEGQKRWYAILSKDPMINNLIVRSWHVEGATAFTQPNESRDALDIRFYLGLLLQATREKLGHETAQAYLSEMLVLYEYAHPGFTLDMQAGDSFWDLHAWAEKVLGTTIDQFDWNQSTEILSTPIWELDDHTREHSILSQFQSLLESEGPDYTFQDFNEKEYDGKLQINEKGIWVRQHMTKNLIKEREVMGLPDPFGRPQKQVKKSRNWIAKMLGKGAKKVLPKNPRQLAG